MVTCYHGYKTISLFRGVWEIIKLLIEPFLKKPNFKYPNMYLPFQLGYLKALKFNIQKPNVCPSFQT